jgi:hypothetical protein
MALKKEKITSLSQTYNYYQKKKSNLNNDYFGFDSREELHWGKMFMHMFDEFYSAYRYKINADYKKIIDDLSIKYNIQANQIIKIERAEKYNYSGYETEHNEYLLIAKESLMVAIHDEGLLVYYGANIPNETLLEIKEIANKHWIKKEIKKSFQMIARSGREYELTEFDLQFDPINININYNDDFVEINEIIINSINEYCKKGLILLHGLPGTGKTSYIRHLIGSIQDKQFIYLPNYLIDNLNSPDFLPFIIAQCKNSVLILEDCESALMHREGGNYIDIAALSTLLNLGDGLLGDALSLQVICTFNANLTKIDDALLRKGRLIARYEFKELETHKAQKLADTIKKEVIIDQPMTLADIYNIETKNFQNTKRKKVGFCVG